MGNWPTPVLPVRPTLPLEIRHFKGDRQIRNPIHQAGEVYRLASKKRFFVVFGAPLAALADRRSVGASGTQGAGMKGRTIWPGCPAAAGGSARAVRQARVANLLSSRPEAS